MNYLESVRNEIVSFGKGSETSENLVIYTFSKEYFLEGVNLFEFI